MPLLHNLMAYELLVAVGTYQDAELFEYGNRVPLNASITPEFESSLRWLLIEQPRLVHNTRPLQEIQGLDSFTVNPGSGVMYI